MSENVELVANVPQSVVDDIKALARANGYSELMALVQSIKVNKFLDDRERGNAKVLLEYPDGRIVRLERLS